MALTDQERDDLRTRLLTNLDNWEKDYEVSAKTRGDQVYAIPEVDDMAAVLLRSSYKSEHKGNAAVVLSYLADMADSPKVKKLVRKSAAVSAAHMGLARLEALQAITGFIAPDLLRAAKGMPKVGKNEQDKIVGRGSDLRDENEGQQRGLAGAR